MPFDFDSVKEFLRCPVCHGELVKDDERLVCTNPEQRLAFPIKDGIPILLPDDGTELNQSDWNDIMERSRPN